MSCYYLNLRCKKTDEVHRIFAIDDYFGRHDYGYKLPNGEILQPDELHDRYHPREE